MITYTWLCSTCSPHSLFSLSFVISFRSSFLPLINRIILSDNSYPESITYFTPSIVNDDSATFVAITTFLLYLFCLYRLPILS